MIAIVDNQYGSMWKKHCIFGAVFFIVTVIAMDLGIVQVHFWTTKTSKNNFDSKCRYFTCTTIMVTSIIANLPMLPLTLHPLQQYEFDVIFEI